MLKETFIQAKIDSKENIDIAAANAHDQQRSLIEFLINENVCDSANIVAVLSKQYGVSVEPLDNFNLTQLHENFSDHPLCLAMRMLPIKLNQQLICVIYDPTDIIKLDELSFKTHNQMRIKLADYRHIIFWLTQLLNQQIKLHINQSAHLVNENQLSIILDKLFISSIYERASDIHFEPNKQAMQIRRRIDGLLQHFIQIPLQFSNIITARLKILANVDITEHRLPQDGRFTITTPQHIARECRLNVCPTLYGEKLVVRILNNSKTSAQLINLGLAPEQYQLCQSTIQQPQGLILVTGPTGSGKSMTLYAMLQQLNAEQINISTIEDPVEMPLLGINQVNVQPNIGLTFAHALRAFLRQDPDVIMVGEIRDQETAEIALRAAQTGHLVFATLHTNNAAASITRLRAMGIAPYNIGSALQLIIAQRLVRVLCTHCKIPIPVTHELLLQLPAVNTEFIFSAKGCELCHHGYLGRTGVFNLLPVNAQMRELIMQTKTESEMLSGFDTQQKSLWQIGLEKVLQGVTSLEELYRVIGYAMV